MQATFKSIHAQVSEGVEGRYLFMCASLVEVILLLLFWLLIFF